MYKFLAQTSLKSLLNYEINDVQEIELIERNTARKEEDEDDDFEDSFNVSSARLLNYDKSLGRASYEVPFQDSIGMNKE